ncbi:MAG: Mrp/NBP35 family ATP-binding protein [Chthoniobacterales bacterium]|nr:Mrp/NBP35 family ATP-binding protein [Chthoniobacterales bacterium]
MTNDDILQALKNVKYPGFSRDIVSFGLVKKIDFSDGKLEVLLGLTSSDPKVGEEIRARALEVLKQIPEVKEARVLVDMQAPTPMPASLGPTPIEGVKTVIAVASGKGGVGKSTIAANLAAALALRGAKTGLCDCDIYGPSIALMFGTNERPYADELDRIIPVERHGVRFMSMGLLLDDHSPAVLRGPMVSRYTQQFLRQVAWGELDFLILDLPPGTGDIQLTVVQTVALTGAIVVTTPQEVALIDARKAVAMFNKTSVPVIGIVENMSYFLCPSDGQKYDIFGSGGGEREAHRLGVPLLAQIPIEPTLRQCGDMGIPIVLSNPDSSSAQCFLKLADEILTLDSE